MPNLELTQYDFDEFKSLASILYRIEYPSKKREAGTLELSKDIAKWFGGMNERTVYNYLMNEQLAKRTISYKSFGLFCRKFEEHINRTNFQSEDWKAFIGWKEKLEGKFRDLKFSKILKHGESIRIDDNKKLLQVATIAPVPFDSSKWYCYERNENGIGRRVIEFLSFNGQSSDVSIKMVGLDTWYGKAIYNPVDHILIITSNNMADKSDYSHYLIKVDSRRKDVRLCIGHLTFKHHEHQNIVTKTIIIIRPEEKEGLAADDFSFDSKHINSEIKEFFKSREKNRLSSPHSRPVFSLESLQEWLNENKNKHAHKPLLGRYNVYYKITPLTKNFVIDKLTITESETAELEIKYEHCWDNHMLYWEGSGFSNFETKVVSAYLTGRVEASKNFIGKVGINDKPIFLMLNIPPRELTEIDTLTGVASAIRDGDRGSVSRLAVLIKEGKIDLSEQRNFNALMSFFDYYSDRSWVRPPITKAVPAIYQFQHLKDAIEDSERRKNENNSDLD